MPYEIPDYYRTLMKDWVRLDLPPHANPHDVAAKCHVPPGSYFATADSLWLETEAYADAVKPLIAAEAIASPASQPAAQPPPLPEQSEPEEELAHVDSEQIDNETVDIDNDGD